MGIVYRYAVREDRNKELKDGVVGAFALTRAYSPHHSTHALCRIAVLVLWGPWRGVEMGKAGRWRVCVCVCVCVWAWDLQLAPRRACSVHTR
jgi:hypothetical protein